MEVNMTINRSIVRYVGACAIAIMAFYNDGLCQTHRVIDIDNGELIILPERTDETELCRSIPDKTPSFNDIFKVAGRVKTSYEVEYVRASEYPIISNERVFIELDHKKSVYDLTSVKEITDAENLHYFDYKIIDYSKRVYTKDEGFKSRHGYYPSKDYDYHASIDVATRDTLWRKQTNEYVLIKQANHVSLVDDSIIDNKSGKMLLELKSSSRLNIRKIIEDDGYLYLIRSLKNSTRELVAIDMRKGEVVWRNKGEFVDIFIDNNIIYTSDQCAIDKKTGKLVWCKRFIDCRVWGIVGNYLIALQYMGDGDPDMFLINKETGEMAAYLWNDSEVCIDCLGFDETCNPHFVFAEQGEGNRTVGLIRCIDGVYLYVFEVK